MNVVLQSAFSRPSFPLDGVEPDLTNVPLLPAEENCESSNQRNPSGSYEMFADEDTQRDSFIIEFQSGIRGYCTPTALADAAHLLEKIQLKVRLTVAWAINC